MGPSARTRVESCQGFVATGEARGESFLRASSTGFLTGNGRGSRKPVNGRTRWPRNGRPSQRVTPRCEDRHPPHPLCEEKSPEQAATSLKPLAAFGPRKEQTRNREGV